MYRKGAMSLPCGILFIGTEIVFYKLTKINYLLLKNFGLTLRLEHN